MSLNNELRKTKQEIDRLVRNWRALLDIMPEMVVLIREDFIIEYMNPSAISVFGNLCGKLCKDCFCSAGDRCQNNCPVQLCVSGKKHKELVETRIGDVDVEYSYVPFEGYLGDRLIMLVMRDITDRKLHELEIDSFHTNIEEILQNKIAELKESENTRKDLSHQVNL